MTPKTEFSDGRLLKAPRVAPKRKPSSMPKATVAALVREAFLEGVKVGTLWEQIERLGYAYCERTNEHFTALEDATHFLHQHHKRQRSVGGRGYSGPGDYGIDHPSNLERITAAEHAKEHR